MELIIGLILGFLSGILSIHINTLLAVLSPFFSQDLSTILFVVSLSTASAVFSFLPTLFLIQDAYSMIGVLPVQKMVLKGKANKVILLFSYSFLLSLLFSMAFLPILSKFIYFLDSLDVKAPVILIVSFLLILSEKSVKKMVYAGFVWLFVGAFGVFVFGFLGLKEPIFPVLSGFFGLSTAILSINQNIDIPKQEKIENIDLNIFYPFFGSVLGALSVVLPGFGISQVVLLFSLFKLNTEKMLALLSSASLSNFIYSFVVVSCKGFFSEWVCYDEVHTTYL